MRRLSRFVLALLLAVIGLAGLAPSASADTPCDTAIYDGTSARVLGNTSSLTAAAKDLRSSIKAEVHVVVIDGLPGGSLDTYKDSLRTQCSSWGGGSLKHNLLVIMVSMQHKSALFYGDDYRAALDGDAETIRDDMGPKFRTGDFKGGILVGLTEAGQTVTQYDSSGPAQQPQYPPPASQPRPSASLTFDWVLAGEISGGIVLVALIVVFFWLRRRHKAAQTELDDVRARVTDDVNALSALITDGDFERRVEILGLQIEDDDNTELKQLETAYVTSSGAVRDEFNRLEALLPVRSWFASGFRSIIADYEALGPKITAATRDSTAYEQYVSTLEREIDNAKADYDTLRELPRQYRGRLEDLQAQGFTLTDVAAQIDQLDQLLTTAKTEIDRNRAGLALNELRAIPGLSDTIKAGLELGPTAFTQVADDTDTLTNKLSKLAREIDEVDRTRAKIGTEYGQRAADQLPTKSELIASHSGARSDVSRARELGSMKQQQWREALAVLDKTRRTVESLVTSVSTVQNAPGQLKRQRAQLKDSIKSTIRRADAESAAAGSRRGEQRGYINALETAIQALHELDGGSGDLLTTAESFAGLEREVSKAASGSARTHQDILDEERRERERQERIAREAREREARAERDRQAALTATLLATSQQHTSYSQPSYSSPSYDPGPSYSPPSDPGGGASGNW